MVDLSSLGLSPLVQTLLIVLLPIIAMLVFFAVRPRHRPHRAAGVNLTILLGIASLSLFYIFAPDPAVIYDLYTLQGNLLVPLVFSIIAAFFLILAVFYFGTASATRTRRARSRSR